jgi:hypothetical protein
VAAGEASLDPALTLPEPVEGGVKIVGVCALNTQLLGQRRLRKLPAQASFEPGSSTR